MNKSGGAERYCLEMIAALMDNGFSVSLYTIDRTDWEHLEKTHSLMIRSCNEFYLREKKLEPLGLLSWLNTAILYLWLLVRGCEEADICINNYGEVMPFFAQVSVIHSVPMSSISDNSYGIPLWGLIQRIYRCLFNYMDQRYGSKTIITNSKYNMRKINEKPHRLIEIVYPPVDLPRRNTVEKSGEILTVSRIKASKELNKIAEIAAYSPRNRFNVAGKTEIGSERLIRQLRQYKNIKVIANPRRETIIQLMNQCSLYLSTQSNEAFGMAIVEAMSLGCVPLIYRDGGPCFDVFQEKEDVGLTYENTLEASRKLQLLLRDEELRNKLRENGGVRANFFTATRFRERFLDVVARLEPMEKWDNPLFTLYRSVRSLRNWARLSIQRMLRSVKSHSPVAPPAQ